MAGQGDGPPKAEAVAKLLRQRYPIGTQESLLARALKDPPGWTLLLKGPEHHYEITIRYLRSENGGEPWGLVSDALDALFGSLIESGRNYRGLPTGEEIRFKEALFSVSVAHRMPSLEAEADRLLGENHHEP